MGYNWVVRISSASDRMICSVLQMNWIVLEQNFSMLALSSFDVCINHVLLLHVHHNIWQKSYSQAGSTTLLLLLSLLPGPVRTMTGNGDEEMLLVSAQTGPFRLSKESCWSRMEGKQFRGRGLNWLWWQLSRSGNQPFPDGVNCVVLADLSVLYSDCVYKHFIHFTPAFNYS